ncbi:MAG: hypothetical protein K2X32_15640 [Phycisphaerales bacterium]|nr:hypothetical protein [Phycisphaerales bacterium]
MSADDPKASGSPSPATPPIKAERILAELDRLRKDLDKDPSDLEWLTLHHVFCFVSYKMTDFRKYIDDEAKRGSFNELDPD